MEFESQMLYTNTDRKHVLVDAIAALAFFNDPTTAFSHTPVLALSHAPSINTTIGNEIIHTEGGGRLHFDQASLSPAVDGAVEADVSLVSTGPTKQKVIVSLRATVEKNGKLSIAALSGHEKHHIQIFAALSCFMGGSFQANDGTYYRLAVAPTSYDAQRGDMLYAALQTAVSDGLTDQERDEAQEIIENSNDGPRLRKEYEEDVLQPVNPVMRRSYLYNGTLPDLKAMLKRLPFSVGEADGFLMVQSHIDLTIFSINDANALDPTSRSYFSLNPAALREVTVITTANDRFMSRWLPDARLVFEVVCERLAQKTCAMGLADEAFAVANVATSFTEGDVLHPRPFTTFFRRADLEARGEFFQEAGSKKTVLHDLIEGMALECSTVEVTTLPDISGNPLFNTVRVCIDGRCADVRFTAAKHRSDEFVGVLVQGSTYAMTPEILMISNYLRQNGGMSWEKFNALCADSTE